ncbi:inner-membrane translocator [Lysinibacillus sp. NPDC096418]|uniref:inner-membrane translocator n=1 Tax=Lysinibacillus sp. NPDC096418 TaxID=3364138 RepID=UPI003828D6B2
MVKMGGYLLTGDLILMLYLLLLISLNVGFFTLFRKGKLNLMVSGIIMIILAPLIGFSSGALLFHFYDWSSGGTGEGAGYGGAFLGLLALANGILVLVIGGIRWILHFVKN